jgi:hypothetical protein
MNPKSISSYLSTLLLLLLPSIHTVSCGPSDPPADYLKCGGKRQDPYFCLEEEECVRDTRIYEYWTYADMPGICVRDDERHEVCVLGGRGGGGCKGGKECFDEPECGRQSEEDICEGLCLYPELEPVR